jgi:hypothetical protein
VKVTGNMATYTDRVSGIAVGFPVLTVSVTLPSKTSRVYKVRAKIVVPTLEVVNASTYSGITPAPTKAYDCLCDINFVLPERSTLVDRKNILAYVKNLMAHATFTSIENNVENVW